jgi:hypothetical protein
MLCYVGGLICYGIPFSRKCFIYIIEVPVYDMMYMVCLGWHDDSSQRCVSTKGQEIIASVNDVSDEFICAHGHDARTLMLLRYHFIIV